MARVDTRRLAGATLLLVALTAVPAAAHELRPAYLELSERAPGEFGVLWKTPMRAGARLAIEPVFSGDATATSAVTTRSASGAAVQEWTLRAPALRGQTLRIDGLASTMTDVLARLEFADGTSWTGRLTARRPEAVIPAEDTAFSVMGVYLGLGVAHILTGWDHLLFVLGLIIVTRGGWKLVKTVTSFSLAHGITLAAATLGFVHVPQRPVEAIIALSIVFLASEILRARHGRAGVCVRAPWIVAFSFGLLHGLGFAGALSEVGLPQKHVPLALLFFSAGVEAGHLLFIAAVISLAALAARRRWQPSPVVELVPTYAIGSVAAFWLVQRISLF